MKDKRRFSVLLTALAAATLLSSCGGTQGSSDSGTTLTVMGRKTDMQKSYLASIFEQYEQATGNKLEIIAYEDAEFEAKAAAEFNAGHVPDIFMHFHSTGLNAFGVDEHFLSLNDEAWADDLTDSARAYCTDKDGDLLGLPFWESSVSGCYYNKTLLDSLGLKPAATQTEFNVLCQALADVGYTPICWPANGCSWMPQFALDPIFADDPELLERLNHHEISFADIPAVTDMVQWVKTAADSGWFGSDYLRCGWDDIGPALTSGEAVMTFIWDTWFYTDFAGDGKYTVDDFALMPVFMGTADSGTYEGGNLNMMMVNKNSAQLETALDFLAFCATPENYNKAFENIATVSCFKGQTTNIQSRMVTEAKASIEANERVSTATSKIIGYNSENMTDALNNMLCGMTDVTGCVQQMDEFRIREAGLQGAEGFPAVTPDAPAQ